MHAIVATTRALLLVDLVKKRVTPVEWDRPEYYGISWFPDGDELALSHSNLDNGTLKDAESYSASEVGVLSHGRFTSEPFLSQPHQLLCGSDGRIICTNTGRNSIVAFHQDNPSIKQEVRISDARWDRLSLDDFPGDHLNSVFEKGDRLYVIAHGHRKGAKLATLSYPELELLSIEPIKDRTGLHNIWVTDDGQRITCHSEGGSVVDLQDNVTLWASGSPIYTRGLAASADIVLVGESQKVNREERKYSTSALWVIDRSIWRSLDYVYLGPYGAVHEVRLLDVQDEAHHGVKFAGFAKLIERDCAAAMAKERMNASARAQSQDVQLDAFELVYGSPAPVRDRAWSASSADLCLLIKRQATPAKEATLRFSYKLDHPAGNSHVAVVAYRGKGGDTDMDAILIQRSSDAEAIVTYYVNDGRSWAPRPECLIENVPVCGNVEFRFGYEGINLLIDGRKYFDPVFTEFSLGDSKLGIRWIGATVSEPD